MSESGRCRDCAFWVDGGCDGVGRPDPGFGWEQDPAKLFDLEVTAADDTGLSGRLLTGPDFGCVRFTPRPARRV